MATSSTVAKGFYRIRQAGAKSQIAISIHNGKKCHYVQIGTEQTPFSNIDDCLEFVEGKGLEADSMSLDFGKKAVKPAEETGEEDEEVVAEPTE